MLRPHSSKIFLGLSLLACSSSVTAPVADGSEYVLVSVNGVLVSQTAGCQDVVESRLTIHNFASGAAGIVTVTNRLSTNGTVVVQSDTLQYSATADELHFTTIGPGESVATASITDKGNQMIVRHRGCVLRDQRVLRDIWSELLYVKVNSD